MDTISKDVYCAKQKALRGDTGIVACDAAHCLVSLFVREGMEPVDLNSFTYCGQDIYPVDSTEWTPVVVSERQVRVNGAVVTRIATRNTLVPRPDTD